MANNYIPRHFILKKIQNYSKNYIIRVFPYFHCEQQSIGFR